MPCVGVIWVQNLAMSLTASVEGSFLWTLVWGTNNRQQQSEEDSFKEELKAGQFQILETECSQLVAPWCSPVAAIGLLWDPSLCLSQPS